jgi:hypothetical protein
MSRYIPDGVIDYRCANCGKKTIFLETVKDGWLVKGICKECIQKKRQKK